MVRARVLRVAAGALSTVGALASGAVGAQEQADPASGGRMQTLASLEEITVTATRSRLPANLESVPGSVTIIDAAEMERQTRFTNDLAEVLQRTVPGLGVSSGGSYSNFDQTLRGRKPAVFIDGVPATVPLRDGGRDLRLISPGVIGRVEVIRGATALYGLGASGGVINYATREPTDGPTEVRTDVGVGGSLTQPSDSLNWSVEQSVVGKVDRVSFVASGFYEVYNSLFDASGNRIPPDPQLQGGIADTDTYDLYGKIGFDLTDDVRIYLSTNLYHIEQGTEYSAGLGVFGSVATPAVRVTPLGEDQFTRSQTSIARYVHQNLFLGSELNVSGYYSEYDARYAFFASPTFPPNGGQSQIESRRWGVRSDINTPLTIGGRAGSVLWGVDYTHDSSLQKMVDGRTLVPELAAESYAPFFQLELPVSDWLNVRGGARYDDTTITVDTFTTIPIYDGFLPGGVTVQGGEVGYSKLFGNIGVVTSPIKSGALAGVSFYAGFSQGYSVGDFGRALRSTEAPSVELFNFQADTVNSYEVGMRTDHDVVRTQLALFYSTSTYGSTFNNVTFENVRAPERIWGAEFVIDARLDNWGWGTSVSWVDGETQDSETDEWSRLDTSRIGPVKTTLYIEHDIGEDWNVRGQFLHSSRQQRFYGNPAVFGQADVEAYSLLDLSVNGRVGPGKLGVAINNLLNEKYYTPDAWRDALDDSFTTGLGTTLRLTYSVDY